MLATLGQIALLDDAQIELLREALDEDELYAMFAALPQAARQSLKAIETALGEDNLDQVRRAAHVLKGVACSFGAIRLASIAREIELELPSIDSVMKCVPLLVETVERTAAALPGRSASNLGNLTP